MHDVPTFLVEGTCAVEADGAACCFNCFELVGLKFFRQRCENWNYHSWGTLYSGIKTWHQVKMIYTDLRTLDLSALSFVANSGSLGIVIFNLVGPVGRSMLRFITFCSVHKKLSTIKFMENRRANRMAMFCSIILIFVV